MTADPLCVQWRPTLQKLFFQQQWKNVLPPRFFIYFTQKEVTMERPRSTGYITRLGICIAPGIITDPGSYLKRRMLRQIGF
jgi:hypothetical protein